MNATQRLRTPMYTSLVCWGVRIAHSHRQPVGVRTATASHRIRPTGTSFTPSAFCCRCSQRPSLPTRSEPRLSLPRPSPALNERLRGRCVLGREPRRTIRGEQMRDGQRTTGLRLRATRSTARGRPLTRTRSDLAPPSTLARGGPRHNRHACGRCILAPWLSVKSLGGLRDGRLIAECSDCGTPTR